MPNQIIVEAKGKMQKSLDHLHAEFGKLQTGRASAALVENIMVENYGSMMPLRGLANISVPEGNQIAIQPWDRGGLNAIEKAIVNANLGVAPQNDGVVIRLIIPPLTEDRRKDLVKTVHKYAEDAKISVRNARHDALSKMKAMEKNKEIGEDELAGKEKDLQKVVDEYNKHIEDSAKHKETDVMTV